MKSPRNAPAVSVHINNVNVWLKSQFHTVKLIARILIQCFGLCRYFFLNNSSGQASRSKQAIWMDTFREWVISSRWMEPCYAHHPQWATTTFFLLSCFYWCRKSLMSLRLKSEHLCVLVNKLNTMILWRRWLKVIGFV